jgi:predicted cobalt transporter CbtA
MDLLSFSLPFLQERQLFWIHRIFIAQIGKKLLEFIARKPIGLVALEITTRARQLLQRCRLCVQVVQLVAEW